jgi:hypothetical protein
LTGSILNWHTRERRREISLRPTQKDETPPKKRRKREGPGNRKKDGKALDEEPVVYV